jgi:hypothetical protein
MAKTQPAFIQHWKSDYALVGQLVPEQGRKYLTEQEDGGP